MRNQLFVFLSFTRYIGHITLRIMSMVTELAKKGFSYQQETDEAKCDLCNVPVVNWRQVIDTIENLHLADCLWIRVHYAQLIPCRFWFRWMIIIPFSTTWIKTSVFQKLCFIVCYLLTNCADSGLLHCAVCSQFVTLSAVAWQNGRWYCNSMARCNSVKVW